MVKRNRKSTAGFSLLEFLAVMVLVAVLALIAVPIYDSYIKKARFQNVIVAVDSFKLPVAACIQSQNLTSAITGCANGSNGVPAALGTTGDYIAKVEVAETGVITGAATSAGGLSGETYTLTPEIKAGGIITWKFDAANSTCDTNLCDAPA